MAALIAMLAPVSGAHFNPAVTLGFWRTGGIGGADAIAYTLVQIVGAVVGVAVANWTFDLGPLSVATTERTALGMIAAEFVVTFVLVLLILALVRTGPDAAVAPAVGVWITAIVIGTASTGFANPAVTISRALTDTFSGIDPAGVPGFLAAQVVAAGVAAVVAVIFYPVADGSR